MTDIQENGYIRPHVFFLIGAVTVLMAMVWTLGRDHEKRIFDLDAKAAQHEKDK